MQNFQIMNFEKNNLKHKISTNTIIFIIAFLVIFYFAIFTAIQDINLLRASVISDKIETEKKLNREQSMSTLAVKLKKIESDLNKLDNIFIDKNNQLAFITTLENIANYNKVAQNINLSPVTATTNQRIAKSIITINAKGKYLDIVNYLQDIESLNYYVNITSINITLVSPTDGQTKQDLVNLNLSADTYWK